MKIQDETINEPLAKKTTKVMVWPTHVSIEKAGNKLANIGASRKTTHTLFPEGAKFGYAAVIMTAGEYRKRVTALDSTWQLTKTTKPENYEPSIKNLTYELKKSHNEALWELRRDGYEAYLAIEDVWKEKILEAYDIFWLKEIEDEVLDFM